MQAGRSLMQSMLWRGLYYVTAFVINILIARHFQATVSGVIYYISSVYALVLLFTSLSLESGIIYFAAKGEIAISKLYSFSLIWSLVIGVLTFVVVYLFFADAYAEISRSLLIASSVTYILGNLLTTYCSGFFYARHNFALPNIINISSTLLLIVLIPYNGNSIVPGINNENYFYVYFGSFLVQGICLAIAAKIKYIKTGLLHFLSTADFKLLVRYCALAFAGNIIYFLLYRIDYFFVEKYCTTTQLGNYIQVSKLGHLFFILPTILASAILPLAAQGKKQRIDQLLTLISRSIFLLYSFICIIMATTGIWLFPWVFGESFTNMYMPFVLLIPGILSLSGLFTFTAYFAGRDQVKTNIIGSVYALLFVVIADILFIPTYGIEAAALISSGGYIIYQLYIISIFKKEYKTPLSEFFIFKFTDMEALKTGLAAAFKNTNEK